jgi:membrane protease YdiL (CAAX protease family)
VQGCKRAGGNGGLVFSSPVFLGRATADSGDAVAYLRLAPASACCLPTCWIDAHPRWLSFLTALFLIALTRRAGTLGVDLWRRAKSQKVTSSVPEEEWIVTTKEEIQPLKLWKSVVFFLGPGLYGVLAYYVLMPLLEKLGMSQENAYSTTHLSVFALLFLLTALALRNEGQPLTAATLRDRLRFRRMNATDWKWTAGFLVPYLLLGLGLNTLAQSIYQHAGFRPPDADIALTNIPIMLVVFAANVCSEELWWRGYILPRQELAHGKFAFLVNGILWSLFHAFKWWAVPFLILRQWMLPYVAQRTKNTTTAFLFHLVSNGLGVLLSIIPQLVS